MPSCLKNLPLGLQEVSEEDCFSSRPVCPAKKALPSHCFKKLQLFIVDHLLFFCSDRASKLRRSNKLIYNKKQHALQRSSNSRLELQKRHTIFD